MAEFVAHLTQRRTLGFPDAQGTGEDTEARFLKAASDVREMTEGAPERVRAVERFKTEATEESWRAARKLLGPSDD